MTRILATDLRLVQAALAARGLYSARVDGRWGPGTYWGIMEAVRGYGAPTGPLTGAVGAQPKATRLINEIIIHCTATPEGNDYTVEQIRQWHLARGFNDIGYHYVVHLDGTVEAGRAEALIGAHVAGHNTGTLGVVYVGGVETDGKTAKDTRTPAQEAALMATCRALMAKYPAINKISGHNQYANKACPSFYVPDDPLGKLPQPKD